MDKKKEWTTSRNEQQEGMDKKRKTKIRKGKNR